jgi:RNA polymerase sigma-70 factor (ECF subfamily)
VTQLEENRELLRAFRAGERWALTQVYREYARPVFSLVTRGFDFESSGKRIRFAGFREPSEIESLVHEVFVRAFGERARLAFDGLRPYRNYLFSIARNLVADEFRRRSRSFVVVDDVEAEASTQVTPAVEPGVRVVEDTQLERRVQEFLSTLAPEEKDLFVARFERGCSIEETAASLRLSERRVKAVERRLRRRFFSTMRRHGYFEGYEWRGAGIGRSTLALVILEALCA